MRYFRPVPACLRACLSEYARSQAFTHRQAGGCPCRLKSDFLSINIDYVWLHWATQGPLYYLMAQLAWDPFQDGHAVMEDYFRRAYGPAVEAMTAYWTLVEDNPGLLTDALMSHAGDRLAQAENAAADGPVKYRERVGFTRQGLEYVALVRESRDLMKRYRQSEGKDEAAAAKARENWQTILRMNDARPELFRRGSVANRHDRPSDRLGDVHPDY